MGEESAMSSVESSGVSSSMQSDAGPPAPEGPTRPWLSSKGILVFLCVFLICMCAIIGLVIYLIMLKGSQLPGGKDNPEPEGPER
uniref:Uncharacterized protein n=1 Tax=Rhipicephalus appendiculatus TaxID=34631 RepID=A0A131YHA0_RHIAP